MDFTSQTPLDISGGIYCIISFPHCLTLLSLYYFFFSCCITLFFPACLPALFFFFSKQKLTRGLFRFASANLCESLSLFPGQCLLSWAEMKEREQKAVPESIALNIYVHFLWHWLSIIYIIKVTSSYSQFVFRVWVSPGAVDSHNSIKNVISFFKSALVIC